MRCIHVYFILPDKTSFVGSNYASKCSRKLWHATISTPFDWNTLSLLLFAQYIRYLVGKFECNVLLSSTHKCLTKLNNFVIGMLI